MNRHPSKSAARRERGFALLITITLLAFLVLLLVSLASLTRVETQVATNSQQLSQARQNALMALNIALGQLQKYAGPDQRTTARADIDATLASTTTQNGRWTGVYGSAVAANYSARPESVAIDLTTSANISSKGSPARLLNWLVSGNESTAFDPATAVAADGHITTAPASFAFTPASTVDLTTVSASPKTTDTQALLVGSHSVTTPSDFVAAPLRTIDVPPAQIPGANASSATPIPVGRYAWWVGDEGAKARVNLPLAGTDTTLTATQKFEQRRNAFSNSTRTAIELMAKADNTWPPADMIGTDYTPDESLNKITTVSQMPLTSSTPASLATFLKYRFHDVTAQSISILSDTYAGGLKRDLSKLLDSSYNASAATDSTTANATRMWLPHSGDTGGFVAGGGFEIPTWKHLRSYYQTRIPTAPGAGILPILPANDKTGYPDHVGVAPVLTYFSVGYRVAPVAAPSSGVQIAMNLYPLVVLWNPYNFTIKAPAADATGGNYEVGINPTYNVQVTFQAGTHTIHSVTGVPTITWKNRGYMDFQKLSSTANNGNFIRFRLNCPDIPPGQSLIFSLPDTSSGNVYTQRNILENIDPEPGAYVSVPLRKTASDNSAATVQPGEESLDYKLISNSAAPPVDDDPVNNDDAGYGTGSSFRGGGGIIMWLGQPDNTSLLATTGGTTSRDLFNPSKASLKWYNTPQEMDWSGLVVSDPIQEPGPLVYDRTTSEPIYVFQSQALFAGQGSNAQLNGNQYMFSTRWLAQGNMRATRSGRTRRDNNFNPLFTATAGQPNSASGFPWQKFNIGSGSASNRTSAGQGHDWINGAPVDVTLFEFPYDNQPLQSIGQLQHANLSLVGAYPSYPIGNSLADFRLSGSGGSKFASVPAGWQLARVDKGADAEGTNKLGSDMNGYYDISYLLNRTLWDRYYFSTVPATGTIAATDTFPNTRHLRYDTTVDVQNPDRSAAGLVLAGGFNINSTSEQAWRAILGGSNQLTFDPEKPDDPNTTGKLKASFPRFTRPNAGDDPDDVWKGYRTLDENQIAQLARNIVTEIRNRGPFVSLADFINRRLIDNSATAAEDETFRGTIQAALDSTTTSASGQFPANDGAGTFWSQDALIPNMGNFVNQASQFNYGYYSQPPLQGRFINSATPASAAVKPVGARSAFAPKYITQADILAKIGAGLSARSDTFTIRTYGETMNPATQEINGRAWCEAVVQRLPGYVEDSVNAWDSPASGSASQTFGRKFKIVSFRWLSPNDI
ncbi:MAG TPA: hypothetical protein VK985_16460 [Rariglobus sp.]|nr:hypothetical protein [Rariglobus sp.]